jgi:hypothetical protein
MAEAPDGQLEQGLDHSERGTLGRAENALPHAQLGESCLRLADFRFDAERVAGRFILVRTNSGAGGRRRNSHLGSRRRMPVAAPERCA